jgi:hypothetical protein
VSATGKLAMAWRLSSEGTHALMQPFFGPVLDHSGSWQYRCGAAPTGFFGVQRVGWVGNAGTRW